ncbi:MAG: hypothetical protein AAB729_01770 [Patescibacteria group bacterium]
MSEHRKISDEEKLRIANSFIQPAAEYFKKELGTEGPEEANERGVGFTRKSSDDPPNPGKHPVEFRSGASNVDAIEAEEKK